MEGTGATPHGGASDNACLRQRSVVVRFGPRQPTERSRLRWTWVLSFRRRQIGIHYGAGLVRCDAVPVRWIREELLYRLASLGRHDACSQDAGIHSAVPKVSL